MAIAHRFSGKGGEDKGSGGCGGGKLLEGSDKIAVELIQHPVGNELFNLPDHSNSSPWTQNLQLPQNCNRSAVP
jgi:hypothetical protein